MSHKHGPKRRDDSNDFPALLVIIGLFLVAIVWVGIFRPHILDFLLFQSSPSPPRQPPNAVTLQENVKTLAQPTQSPTEETLREETSSHAETVGAGGKQGEFYRYTDEEGTIHLADNPENIPEKYRHQMKVYNSHKLITQVRIVNNQVLVPVTLRNGYQEVQATMVLDTGCTTTSISAELASRLLIDPARTRPGTSKVADGRSVPNRVGVIDQMTVGPKTKEALEISIMPRIGPQELADGLLGMNFLRDFRYQIDTASQHIIWH